MSLSSDEDNYVESLEIKKCILSKSLKLRCDAAAVATTDGARHIELATTHKKKITETARWKSIKEEEFFTDNQWTLVNQAADYYRRTTGAGGAGEIIYRHYHHLPDQVPPPHYALLLMQIQQKLYGYRNQDVLKNKYDLDKFITIAGVFDLFLREDMRCYYCHKIVLLLYEFIREPRQWTLDRIDNSCGHNHGNLYLACLSCNLRRRCLQPEKYVMTQKCAKVIRLPAAAAAADSDESGETTTSGGGSTSRSSMESMTPPTPPTPPQIFLRREPHP